MQERPQLTPYPGPTQRTSNSTKNTAGGWSYLVASLIGGIIVMSITGFHLFGWGSSPARRLATADVGYDPLDQTVARYQDTMVQIRSACPSFTDQSIEDNIKQVNDRLALVNKHTVYSDLLNYELAAAQVGDCAGAYDFVYTWIAAH